MMGDVGTYICILQSPLARLMFVCESTEEREVDLALFHFFSAAISFSSDFRRQYRRDLLLRKDVKLL